MSLIGDGPLGDIVILPPIAGRGLDIRNAVETRIENILIQGGAKIVMVSGDVLWHDCDTASGLDIWVSYIDTISE